MEIVIISNPQNFTNEHRLLTALFECGLEYLHVRKPGYSRKDISKYIELIPEKYHSKLIIHKYIELYSDYNIKGIHFGKENSHLLYEFEDINIQKSVTTHSLDELVTLKGFDYIFLSPVFDSITKHGYRSMFAPRELNDFFKNNTLDTKVIALGGVTVQNIENALSMGFDGAAVMGALWDTYLDEKNISKTVSYFNVLKDICRNFVRQSPQ